MPFNIKMEFDHHNIDEKIHNAIAENKKGYICCIESNNLTIANNNYFFRSIINNSLINICDGSILAILIGFIHKKKLKPYIAADLFIKYIQMKKYSHYFLGNTIEVLQGLKRNLSSIDARIQYMPFVELPFMSVEDFDYKSIAASINAQQPDIIWISLGAPKQEIFMSKILPYINKGIMFGIGAVFNFYYGTCNFKRAPKLLLKFRLEWLYRAFEEPKKNVPRYLNFIRRLPILVFNEYRIIQHVGDFSKDSE